MQASISLENNESRGRWTAPPTSKSGSGRQKDDALCALLPTLLRPNRQCVRSQFIPCQQRYQPNHNPKKNHNPNPNPRKGTDDAHSGDMKKRDVGRQGNNASVKCTVCNVYLCDKKGRFPTSTKTCWELWHSVPDFVKGGAETLCHLRNPSREGWDTIVKQTTNKKSLLGGARGVAASVATTTQMRATLSRGKK
jgi:hypothetical protein